VRRRLLLSYLSITIFVLLVLEIPLGVAYARSERRRLTSDVQHDALALAIRTEESLEGGDNAALQRIAERYERDTGGRVVVVDAKGNLVADSSPPKSGPRSFATRPEFKAALAGREASGTRGSNTLGETLLYFAVPIVHGSQVEGALRVTYPTSFVDARIHRSWLILGGVAVIVLAVVFLVSLRLARQISRPLSELEDAAARLGEGELSTRAPVPSGPEEIRVLASSFNQTAARLEQLVSLQQSFVADASHQLRTPLAALRLRLENLEDEIAGASPDAADDVSGALAEVARLSRLVDGLLELARAEQGATNPTDVDLAEIVAGRVDAWSAFASERDVRLASEVPDGLVARATSGRLEQVLDNLVSNALEVSPPGGVVDVTASAAGGGIELRVADEGPGMPEEQRARAFDRFWRAPSASRGGSGLGLAIVQRLVVSDGGDVELRPAPGGGLEVLLRLRAGRGRERAREPAEVRS
jgi:signal transduction histidine kinase